MGKLVWGLAAVGIGVIAGALVLFGVVPAPMMFAAKNSEAPPSVYRDEQTTSFMAQILTTTETFWAEEFKQGRLPKYGPAPTAYTMPVLVVFRGATASGCGGVEAKIVGPIFCTPDHKLYIDPQFYDELAKEHRAPGDFAQAFVIGHEVSHHVQDLIGAVGGPRSESDNRQSVRYELQADCFAGAWTRGLEKMSVMEPGDLEEGIVALTNIGDDVLMKTSASPPDPARFTHGSGAQRVRWFKRGHAGDARDCDTFSAAYEAL